MVVHEVDDEGLAQLRTIRDDLVCERVTGTDHFVIDHGPFTHWDRRLVIDRVADGQHRVVETIEHRAAVGP